MRINRSGHCLLPGIVRADVHIRFIAFDTKGGWRMEGRDHGFGIEHLLMPVATFFWALGHPVGRIILQEVHPFQLGSVTLGVGFISLLVFCAVTGRIKTLIELPKKDLFLSLLLGILGFFLYQILTFSALKRIPASMNAILISTNVILIMLFAALFLRERIGKFRIIGILLAAAGVFFVIFNRGFELESGIGVLGCLFSMGAAIVFSLYSVFAKRILEENDPVVIVTLALFSGAVLLLILSSLTVGIGGLVRVKAVTWVLMLVLGTGMIGISYPIWFFCLKKLPASQISIYIYTTPMFAVILSLVILEERFSWLFWLGGALILGGIVSVNLFSQKTGVRRQR